MACILRSPTFSSPFQPIRSNSSPETLARRIDPVMGPVERVAPPRRRPEASIAGAKARALLVGPVDHDDGMFRLDVQVVEGADDLEPAENAQHAVILASCRLGVEGGCRHKTGSASGSVPSRRANMLPISSRPMVQPARLRTSFGTAHAPRRLRRSGSGGCCHPPRPARSLPSPSASPRAADRRSSCSQPGPAYSFLKDQFVLQAVLNANLLRIVALCPEKPYRICAFSDDQRQGFSAMNVAGRARHQHVVSSLVGLA